jgi:uncharacterized OsmC-like protein
VTGEIEKEGSVLVVKRIHVEYQLTGVALDEHETVERVLAFHADKCPVARSVSPQITITTSVKYL